MSLSPARPLTTPSFNVRHTERAIAPPSPPKSTPPLSLHHPKSPLTVPPLYHDDGESELESEDDGFEHTQTVHSAMDLDSDPSHELASSPDIEEPSSKLSVPPLPRVVFNDEGESEMEEPESEEEPEVPLLTIHKSKLSTSYLHISHKVFHSHNRPCSDLNAPSPSTSTHLIPYARPLSSSHQQRPWLVASPHVMHARRREQLLMFGENESKGIMNSPVQSGRLNTLRSELEHHSPPQQLPYPRPASPPVVEKGRPSGPRKVLRRPYPCLYRDCSQAFPSPKDRSRHMDKHFEGRFECLRCHKKYARLDALKRHSSEQFRPRLGEGSSTRSHNLSAACVGGFEAKEWIELSGNRWLNPDLVVHLRLPEPQDPLYPQLSRLLTEAHHNARLAFQQQSSTSLAVTGAAPFSNGPFMKSEPALKVTMDVEDGTTRHSPLMPPPPQLVSGKAQDSYTMIPSIMLA